MAPFKLSEATGLITDVYADSMALDRIATPTGRDNW
jgi:hypothetical protein